MVIVPSDRIWWLFAVFVILARNWLSMCSFLVLSLGNWLALAVLVFVHLLEIGYPICTMMVICHLLEIFNPFALLVVVSEGIWLSCLSINGSMLQSCGDDHRLVIIWFYCQYISGHFATFLRQKRFYFWLNTRLNFSCGLKALWLRSNIEAIQFSVAITDFLICCFPL